MEPLKISIQIIIALSIYNVWIIRPKKSTIWRGGNAKNMSEEFDTYGLPNWFMKFVGFSKILLATLLIVEIFVDNLYLDKIGAYGIAVLMIGAILMHVKIKDELKKSLPAFTFLVLSLLITFL